AVKKEYKAKFKKDTYTVHFECNPIEAGYLSQASGSDLAGTYISSTVSVNTNYTLLGWLNPNGDIIKCKTPSTAKDDAYVSEDGLTLYVKSSSLTNGKKYQASFDSSIEDGNATPRIYVYGEGSSARLLLTKKTTNLGTFFQFNSIIAWKGGETVSTIEYNPSNLAPSRWDINWAPTGFTHTVDGLKDGKGDPCRLVGFTQAYVQSEINAGRIVDNGKWRTPSVEEYKSFAEHKSNWTTNSGINGRYCGADATPSGVGGEFVPAAGCINKATGVLLGLQTISYYWSNEQLNAAAAKGLYNVSNDFNPAYDFAKGFGNTVRCVPQ
ncbi:MAG: hypothetical protein ACRCZZ_02995, partial [Phocaeicola sp.]